MGLVQHFDMVWLHHTSIPVGEEGVNFLVEMISTCLATHGEGGRHPVGRTQHTFSLDWLVADGYFNYLCTYDLYGLVCKVFDVCR